MNPRGRVDDDEQHQARVERLGELYRTNEDELGAAARVKGDEQRLVGVHVHSGRFNSRFARHVPIHQGWGFSAGLDPGEGLLEVLKP